MTVDQDLHAVKSTIKGVYRSSKSSRLPRHPLSPTDLLKVHSSINTLIPADFVFWSALIFMYRCVLRVSHVTKCPHNLKAGDVVVSDNHLIVTIKSSKTDQFGLKPHIITINATPGSCLYPVYNVKQIMAIQNPGPNDPLFRLPSPKGYRTLRYSWFNARLKYLAQVAGLDPKIVSSHSVRHGAATFLQSLGLSVEDIKSKCNWRSSAVNSYLHPSVQLKRKKDTIVAQRLSSFF